MKPHIKKHRGKWGVWRDKHSSTYALPVSLAYDSKVALRLALNYLNGV